MSEYKAPIMIVLAVLSVIAATPIAVAQYWFQSGAQGGALSSHNTGAGITIQTVKQPLLKNGAFGFWVGETLSNGAFIQAGYEVPNTSGEFPANCSPSGCNGSVELHAGSPSWFWEYFPQNYNGGSFYGSLGGDGSAGPIGTFNNYSFISKGNLWDIYFNKQQIGSVDLGTGNSGSNPPLAIAEYANASSNSQLMSEVFFKNLGFYNANGQFVLVPIGYSYIDYGKGSDMLLNNPYGVSEVNSYADYFGVGSGLPTQNLQQLWQVGYALYINSSYGNLTSTQNYLAGGHAIISAPLYIYLSNNTREQFSGWQGTGTGSYTGMDNQTSIFINGNITENARWTTQYYVSVNSPYDNVTGSGWYNNGSAISLAVTTNIVKTGQGSRVVFQQWSNGAAAQNTSIVVSSPQNIFPVWQTQYALNISEQFGNATGAGWYGTGSIATINVGQPVLMVSNDTRYIFYQWSNGNSSSTLNLRINRPMALAAQYKKQYLVKFNAEDAYGKAIDSGALVINGTNANDSVFLDAQKSYLLNAVTYKGTQVSVDKVVSITAPQSINVSAPIYNVVIQATSVLGSPVNATLKLGFKNGTTLTAYTGAKGTLQLNDVPYGYAVGHISYLGMSYPVRLAGQNLAIYPFLTPLPIVLIIIGVIITIVLTVRAKRSVVRRSTPQISS